ncbi:MAG: glycosyltransferase family 4 protein [Flavitalea sp.]
MKNVLYLGPEYKNHRGGIGAVLEVYSRNAVPFKFIPTYSNKSFPHKLYVYIRAACLLIYTLITDRSIKIVHIHSASRGSFMRKSFLLMISKLFGKKVIIHIHGAEFHIFYAKAGWLRAYIRFILQKADVVICLSNKWKEYFTSNFKIKELAIINNVIEKAPGGPLISGNGNGHVNFLFLGFIGNRKGIFDFLEVLQNNRASFDGKYTVTVGGNGEVERLQQVIADYHPNGDVQYAGWVNGDKKVELLQRCDVYVLPSYNEGLPISVLEALAYGKPVISTNVGGIPEIVKPGYNGWIFEPGNKAELQHIVQEVLLDKNVWKEYGTHSLIISKNYTPESVFQSLDILYKKLDNEQL